VRAKIDGKVDAEAVLAWLVGQMDAYRDPVTAEVNLTLLAEAAQIEFDLSDAEEVYELAYRASESR